MNDELRQKAAGHWQDILAAARACGIESMPALSPQWEKVLALSDFVALSCKKEPAMLAGLLESGDLDRHYGPGGMALRIPERLGEAATFEELASGLRHFRRREMARIAWRDLVGVADLSETMTDLSALAEVCLEHALVRLFSWQCRELKMEESGCDPERNLVVIGMGKLGARELNFSSDIDLIFSYEGSDLEEGREASALGEPFYTRLAQQLIRVIGETTEDGLVFRVDMRLRPYGESGPLVMSFDRLEEYYQNQGREWERYAWIKARVVAGAGKAGERLLETLKPFVFRRYIDFGAFESLRAMKQMIESEVRRRRLEDNVKLGRGGIREAEFIGQAFQMLRGGRFPALQAKGILEVLSVLAGNGFLPEKVTSELRQAYVFLRDTEHRLQEAEDRQIHALPADQPGRARLAFAMGFPGWQEFAAALERHRSTVHGHFSELLASPGEAEASSGSKQKKAHAFCNGLLDEQQERECLAELGIGEPQAVRQLLFDLKQSRQVRALSQLGRSRLDRLMPAALLAIAGQGGETEVFGRLIGIIEAIVRRSAYIALLLENPGALEHLVRLIKASPVIAGLVSRYPLLLDELLDSRTLYAPPDRDRLAEELHRRLGRVSAGDLEQLMEELRGFKHANVLRVAAADVTGGMPIMKVSDHLTFIAEVILEAALFMVWEQLAGKYGILRETASSAAGEIEGFAVVAYGKFGGLELGYDSDLDLIFLRGGEPLQAGDPEAGGDGGRFYNRVAQRLIHVLTAHTAAGFLYPVDMRLRPDGGAGLLLAGIDSFADYQRSRAWTWEHQALVRARVVAGDPALGRRFAAIREEALSLDRDPARLREEIVTMRERLREERKKTDQDAFDLKNDPGGIVDIEFIVQYLVLREGRRHPGLLRWTDNVRILEAISDCGLLSPDQADLLKEAYLAYRTAVHHLALQEKRAETEGSAFRVLRDGVTAIWREMLAL